MITIETIFLAAAIHGVALVLLLTFNSYSNRTANILLAGLVALLTIAMWNVVARKSEWASAWLIVDHYLWVTPLLWAPLLYIYVGQLTRQKLLSGRRLVLHSLPALLAGLVQIPLHMFQETVAGAFMMTMTYKAIVAFIYPQIAVYFILSLRLLKTYSSQLKETHSALEKINVNWLRTVLIVFSIVLLADMSMNIPSVFFGIDTPAIYYAVLLAEACAVFAIGYLSMRQPEILAGISLPVADGEVSQPEKYLGSPLDDQLGAELAERLDQEMANREIFLKNDLTLADLADVMGLSTRHLSQVINQHQHRNFYDYVNGYRARYAAEHLAKHGKTNLTRLAYDSGFNNRVSFSKAFRTYTGQTPTEFLNKQAKRSVS